MKWEKISLLLLLAIILIISGCSEDTPNNDVDFYYTINTVIDTTEEKLTIAIIPDKNSISFEATFLNEPFLRKTYTHKQDGNNLIIIENMVKQVDPAHVYIRYDGIEGILSNLPKGKYTLSICRRYVENTDDIDENAESVDLLTETFEIV